MTVKPEVRKGEDGLFRVYVGEEIYSDPYKEEIFAEHIAERVVELWGPALEIRTLRKRREGIYHWTVGDRKGTVHAESLSAAKRHVHALLRRKRLDGLEIELEE